MALHPELEDEASREKQDDESFLKQLVENSADNEQILEYIEESRMNIFGPRIRTNKLSCFLNLNFIISLFFELSVLRILIQIPRSRSERT